MRKLRTQMNMAMTHNTIEESLSFKERVIKNIKRDKYLLMMVALPVAYFIIFHYIPMYGIVIAFKNFSPGLGIMRSKWVGLQWFKSFFSSIYAGRLISNVLIINFYRIIVCFPIPIIFALFLNEIRWPRFKKAVQTISYLPHFISAVVVVGMVMTFLSPNDGIVNAILKNLGYNTINFMSEPKYFVPVYVLMGLWQGVGWSSIIYLAALAGIDVEQYEAASMDGANRWQQMLHITLPGLAPTIIILLILDIGNMMSVGYEKIILMYNPATYKVADVISTYVYRVGLVGSNYSFGAAIDFFNSVINCTLLIVVNKISKKITDISLW